jgi:uncharacterized Zn-binding protein involved in type VI secretion
MRKLVGVLTTAATAIGLLTLTAVPAQAADGNGVCNLPGSGTSGAPWQIDSQADLLEIGLNDCISTYNQAQHYILTGNIALTGAWTPIELRSQVAASLDGKGFTISGLQILGTADYAGFFSSLQGAVVKDLLITGSSVSGGTFVGTLAGSVSHNSTVDNVHVRLTSHVSGTGQKVGGLIGSVQNSSITNSTFTSFGTVSGTAYCGGGLGSVEGSSTISNIAVFAYTNFTNIGGGVIGSYTSSVTTINGLFFHGDHLAGQYVGGLVGYLWNPGATHAITISNSAVRGNVMVRENVDPAAFIGYVGNGISQIAYETSYVAANFDKNRLVSWRSVTSIALHNGNGATTTLDVRYEDTGGTTITSPGATQVTPISTLADVTSRWKAVEVEAVNGVMESVNPYESSWVLDRANVQNIGRPMPTFAYNADFFGAVSNTCPSGLFSATGSFPCSPAIAGKYVPSSGSTSQMDCPAGRFSPSPGASECMPAPAGSFVPSAGASSATPTSPGTFTAQTGLTAPQDCPAGSFQPAQNSINCIPASIGFFVANAGSANETACAAGTTTLSTGQTACVAIASSGYSGPLITSSTVAAPGEKVTISGSGLSGVTTVKIDGVVCVVNSVSGSSITITLPTTLSSGTKDLVLVSDSGSLTVQGGIKVTGSAVTATGQTASLKRVGDRVRFMVKDVVGAGKIQFKINGKEVAWVRAVDATDPKLRKTSSNEPYFVRTSSLVRGKNAVEIFVDGERVKRASYTR